MGIKKILSLLESKTIEFKRDLTSIELTFLELQAYFFELADRSGKQDHQTIE